MRPGHLPAWPLRQDLRCKPASKVENRTQVSICCAKAALPFLSCSLLFGAYRSSITSFNSLDQQHFLLKEEKNGLEISRLGHVIGISAVKD